MPETAKMRRLVLMFDGTWNERHSFTNVARMFEAVDDYKPDKDDVIPPGSEPLQLVKYLKGVGTKFLTSVRGGAFGYGLSEIIQEGYRWLSNNYRVGDEIFVFGFSRGAYSARSLVSLVHMCGGLLKRDASGEIDEALLKKAYQKYSSYVATKDEKIAARERRSLSEFSAKNYTQPVKVKMLGVWDTVGALGIPYSMFKPNVIPFFPEFLSNLAYNIVPWSRKHYGFHDQNLPCIVEHAYHALAIDEHREDFAPTLWYKRTPENKVVEQAWFVGSHCNCGGGATGDDDEDPDDLWQYAYVWMQHRAEELGLRFYWTYDPANRREATESGQLRPTSSGTIEAKRRVSNTKPEDSYRKMLHGLYSWIYLPYQRPVVGSKGASLHWSVKERIEQDKKYLPESLRFPNSVPPKCRTEIPYIRLDEVPCSCHSTLHAADGAYSTGQPTKKQS